MALSKLIVSTFHWFPICVSINTQSIDPEMIPKSEYNDLRRTSEQRITSLEEEINDWKEKMETPTGDMVPMVQYDTLQRNKKRESNIMQEQLAMLAEEMANTTEKVICDMFKGNESLVENFNFYFLHHFLKTSKCFILIQTTLCARQLLSRLLGTRA